MTQAELGDMFEKIVVAKSSMRVQRVSSFSFTTWWRPAFAALAVFVIGFGSLGYASAGALPGDLLYGFKTRVAEPLEGIAYSVVGKQDVHQEKIALERLYEMGELSARGELSAEEKASLTEALVSTESSESLEVKAKIEDLGSRGLHLDLEGFEVKAKVETEVELEASLSPSVEVAIGELETSLKKESVDDLVGGTADLEATLENEISSDMGL